MSFNPSHPQNRSRHATATSQAELQSSHCLSNRSAPGSQTRGARTLLHHRVVTVVALQKQNPRKLAAFDINQSIRFKNSQMKLVSGGITIVVIESNGNSKGGGEWKETQCNKSKYRSRSMLKSIPMSSHVKKSSSTSTQSPSLLLLL